MLTDDTLEGILGQLPNKTVGLIGDLFLDRYLDIEPALTEASIETGLDAYQVVNVRSYPGAMGTVINNLVALGVGYIHPVSFIGDDGEGYELLKALAAFPAITTEGILKIDGIRTPTYTKPMVLADGKPSRELNRFDIKNRTKTPVSVQEFLWKRLVEKLPTLDALLIVDQVSERNCGVITDAVRMNLARLRSNGFDKFILADSREQIGEFANVWIKPNRRETELLSKKNPNYLGNLQGVFSTDGPNGVHVHQSGANSRHVPAYPVGDEIDIVGAGDSCSAAIACAMACGTDTITAAQFGNLIASITIQQLGVTGTASPAQVRDRWREVGAPR